MKTLLILSLSILSLTSLSAGQKYNGFSNRWETVPEGSQLQYNGFNNTWSYQPRGAQLEYNGFENEWQWNSGHNG